MMLQIRKSLWEVKTTKRTQVFLLLGLVGGDGCWDCNEWVSKGLKSCLRLYGVRMEFTKLRIVIVSHHLTSHIGFSHHSKIVDI